MAKNESAKKNRKRRSFYEPQSKVFNDWLDAQTDLGMSIQLLITDAIETYGDGDAIEAYFRTRIAGGIQPAAKLAPLPEKTLVQPVKQDTPKIVQKAASKTPKPEPAQTPEEAIPAPENVQQTAKPTAPIVEPQIPEVTPDVPTPAVEFDPLANIREDAMRTSSPKVEPEEETYDPLTIMMEDAGSTLNK